MSLKPSPVISRKRGFLSVGEKPTDLISFYGKQGVARPAAARTVRQALEDVGLIVTGGSDTTNTDALSKVAGDTIAEGVDYTLGTTTGSKIGTGSTQKLGFFGATPIVQPSYTAAKVGVTTLIFPIQLASMTTAAADLLTNYVPGYAFKLLSLEFAVTTIGAGASASQVLNLEIGSTNTTGGALTLLLADTDTLGKKTAATAITAANVGTATDTLSIEVATSGTVFTAGEGNLIIKLQNLDTLALATALSNLGLVAAA